MPPIENFLNGIVQMFMTKKAKVYLQFEPNTTNLLAAAKKLVTMFPLVAIFDTSHAKKLSDLKLSSWKALDDIEIDDILRLDHVGFSAFHYGDLFDIHVQLLVTKNFKSMIELVGRCYLLFFDLEVVDD